MKKTILSFLLLALAVQVHAGLPASVGPKALTANANVTSTAAVATVLGPVGTQDYVAATVQLTGITGTAGAFLQGTVDGSNWVTLYTTKVGASSVSLTMTANGLYEVNLSGLKQVRVIPAYITSGSLTANIGLGRGPAGTQLRLNIPTTPTP